MKVGSSEPKYNACLAIIIGRAFVIRSFLMMDEETMDKQAGIQNVDVT